MIEAIQAVINAAKCGAELLKVKDGLPHGEFEKWVEDKMPRSKNKPYLIQEPDSKSAVNGAFDVESELLLLTASNEIEEEVRELSEEEE